MRDVRRARRTAPTDQRCPGACGRFIPVHIFACPEDWNRLPAALRVRVADALKAGVDPEVRRMAHAAASQWLLDYPRVRPL